MNRVINLINKTSKRIKVHYLIVIIFIALFLTFGIPTLARFKNRSIMEDTNLWDGSIATSYSSGSGTFSDPFIISSGAEFAYFTNSCGTTGCSDTYFALGDDILLNDGTFTYNNGNLIYTKNGIDNTITPYLDTYAVLNKFSSMNTFSGHLDGNSYRIYGLFITSNDEEVALIKNLSGEIKDLYIENSVIYGGYNTAGLAANSNSSTITNVLLNGYVIGKNSNLSTSKNSELSDITKTTRRTTNETVNYTLPFVNGNITSVKLVGNYSKTGGSTRTRLSINGTTINEGDFELDLGINDTSFSITYTPRNINTTYNLTNLTLVVTYDYSYASGIVGTATDTTMNGIINKGSVIGNMYSNGLVNNLSGSSTIINSYNKGTITGGIANGLVNAINENTTSITITYSYNSGTLNGTNMNNGLVNSIVDNTGYIGIGRCFNTTSDYVINNISGSDLLINSVGTLTNGVRNGTITNGNVDIISDFVSFARSNAFNEFVDLEDLNTNTTNLWVYDSLPILYIDDINNPIASINLNTYSWNSLGYRLRTYKFNSSFTFTITSLDNLRGIKEVYYYLNEGTTPLRKSEIEAISNWESYNNAVEVEDEGFYIIYVKIIDNNDDIYYLNSDLLVLDLSASEITITMDSTNWNSLDNTLEDLYFNTNRTISISAYDELSGVNSISYYLSDSYLSSSDVESIDSWVNYTDPITIDQRTGKVLYVKVVDNVNYIAYANSAKILIDGYRQSSIVAGKNTSYTGDLVINDKSSVSYTYTFSDNNNYKNTYKHQLVSNSDLPVNTIITLIDNTNSRSYRYKVTTPVHDILFNKFTEIGNTNNVKYSEPTSGHINDNFKINLDFSETTLESDITNLKIYMELLDGERIIRPIMATTVTGFNVVRNSNYTVGLTSDFNNTIYYNTINTYNIGFNATYSMASGVIDTTLENKNIGIALRVLDSNSHVVSKRDLRNIVFTYNGNVYSAGSDGVIRINLNNGLSNTTGTIRVDTSIDNIKLTSGDYTLQLGYFVASDGSYSKDITYTKNISLSVLNSNVERNYTFNVTMDNTDRMFSIGGSKNITFRVLLNSDIGNPIVRVSLYRKTTLSAYNQSYTKVDLGSYLNTELTLYNDLIYNTSINTNSSEYRNFVLDFDTTNFSHNGYKLIFDLYDGDTKVDSISKNIIVR